MTDFLLLETRPVSRNDLGHCQDLIIFSCKSLRIQDATSFLNLQFRNTPCSLNASTQRFIVFVWSGLALVVLHGDLRSKESISMPGLFTSVSYVEAQRRQSHD